MLISPYRCGGAIGLYFQLKRCSMLYLYAGKGAFGNPPYLDVHGETDVLMRYVSAVLYLHSYSDPPNRRGRLQFLHAQRLEDLRKTWLNHGIPTFVARKLDGTIDPGGWETM
jgi:E3 ubiquitin-protein ligase UBR1